MDETKLSVPHEHGQKDGTHGITNLPEAESKALNDLC